MKAEELTPRDLRIGNILTLSGSLILTLYEIHEDCFYAKDANGSSFKNTWADLKPIPLSEEVLLKCGVILEEEDRFVIKDDDFDYIIDTDVEGLFLIGLRYSKEVKYFSSNVLYLHQLQNLYYALTGEELEVKWS